MLGAEYEATVVEHDPNRPDVKQTTTGGAKTTAAWLRAVADEMDPPQSPAKTCRTATSSPFAQGGIVTTNANADGSGRVGRSA